MNNLPSQLTIVKTVDCFASLLKLRYLSRVERIHFCSEGIVFSL